MQRRTGFTLIEVMIVLALLAVLAALAIPNYAGYTTKSRRTEAQVALVELMQQQERYFTQHHSYIGFSADSADPQEQRFKWYLGPSAAASAYELSARACPGAAITACVELQAVPGTARVNAAFADPGCGTLTLNSAGDRRASGTDGKFARCWP